ncbi:uncharacterized protein Nmag_2975 [Natrialba magadii ATCC 43099]|uniref:DUF456 domain-containing protein n=1 Tax=Natrialba magadii (strain ATCC 43099 / DSM 3394 / CCM 3739 / CIP 104546 / IAM 13178 / JCM 8861 / NBRC 102185 / NCIMB 2190 / MS3) TaxID=547559 RepID=D3T0P8_NATMM|nr:hypothetical protein [Natrialba magadii]ADD06527.1 uncharacterized protein Nmag_2975 [Natrialba magadii ATCC 43099]ELY32011.1 hypothetical protein C500_05518 [Natrialba magadii ATCC 43099]
MNDRSDEVTEQRDGDPRSTDDLLSETEQLLSETGGSGGTGGTGGAAGAAGAASAGDPDDPGKTATTDATSSNTADPGLDEFSEFGSSSKTEPELESRERAETGSGGSRLGNLTGGRSLEEYFSPKAFLALVLTLGAGLFAGGAVIPVAGQLVGIFAAAFLIGVIMSKRRYMELTGAGITAGMLTTLDPVYFALGSGLTLLGIGAAIGFVASVAGYYFGRDLRDGLVRDVP